MGWPRGKPRPPNAGRKKGKLNRKTDALFDLCDEMGINPFEALLRLSQNIDVEIQLGALKEICKYLYPQRKAIEHTGESIKISGPIIYKTHFDVIETGNEESKAMEIESKKDTQLQ